MRQRVVSAALAVLMLAGCGAPVANNSIIPLANNPIVQAMPEITPEMQTAGYWIDKADLPDEIIMSADEIEIFNALTAADHRIIKVSEYGEYKPGDEIRTSITTLYDAVADQGLYFENGSYANKKSLSAVYARFQLEKLNGDSLKPISFGIITENISHRVLPTDEKLMRKGDPGYFDRLQMSSLDAGTPVAVLWRTADGKWLYARSALTVGWVKVEHVALCSLHEIEQWEKPVGFVITTRYRTSVHSDPALREYISWLALGSRLPIDKTAIKADNRTAVLWPGRDGYGWLKVTTGYVDNSFVCKGYLPYTSRNALNLAFEMLHAPYGWGGMYGEQDCSGFVLRIFGAMGLILPRNSSQQGNSGDIIYSGKMVNALSTRQIITFFGVPGATVLQLPGHIMLYVGSVAGEPYAIHAIWSFEVKNSDNVALRLPARVVVSGLNMGGHSKRGPYHERVTNVRVMRLPRTTVQ